MERQDTRRPDGDDSQALKRIRQDCPQYEKSADRGEDERIPDPCMITAHRGCSVQTRPLPAEALCLTSPHEE